MKGYMTSKEAADKWGISSRQVQIYCKNGRVPGAQKIGTSWVMPDNLKKPSVAFICEEQDENQDEENK